MKDLTDRVVVITGAGSGIGRAAALAFAREGARLHLADLRLDAARAACEAVRAMGGRATDHLVDCTDAAAVEKLAEAVFDGEGRVDVLHLNAGVWLAGPVERFSLAQWRWITDVNLWGVIHGVHVFVPRMIQQGGGGHLITTASMAGLMGLPYVAPYCATKFAVVGLSEALSAELAPHDIQVTCVCTGMVRTNVAYAAQLEVSESMRRLIEKSYERWAPRPEDVAHQIVAAVRAGRSLVIRPGELLPGWALRRLSSALYQRASGAATRLARWGLDRLPLLGLF